MKRIFWMKSKLVSSNGNWVCWWVTRMNLSMQSDHLLQPPGSDDSVSMEKQENVKFFPVSMQLEKNSSCCHIKAAHAIFRHHKKRDPYIEFMKLFSSWSMRWTIMKCAVAGGSRCTKAVLHPGCTSLWLLTLTPRFTLLLAFISSCQASRPREEVGGAQGAGALRWGQGFFLSCH